jgi:hypothetical protein
MNRFAAWETHNLAKFAKDAYARIQELEEMKTHAPKIRELLRQAPDGMTICQLSDITGIRKDTITTALSNMPDAYIDRWEGPYRGQWAAVWCVVVPPPNCPRPSDA